MSDSTQKPINSQSQIPAGGAPAEAPKPREPTHEEILTGFKSQAKARKILAGSIAKNASKRIAELEARKEGIANAAKVEREDALNRFEQERKEKEAFLQNSRQEDLDRLHGAAEGSKTDLKGQFENLKVNLSDPFVIEQAEKELADKIKEIDELESKADATREEEHEAYMAALQEDGAARLAEIETNYLANMSITSAVGEEIAKVKYEKEARLKEIWSSKLDGNVDETIESEPDEEAVGSAVGSGVKKAAIVTAALLTLYFGSKYHSRVPTYQNVQSLSVSSDIAKPFMPLGSTGLAGVRKPAEPKQVAIAMPKGVDNAVVEQKAKAMKPAGPKTAVTAVPKAAEKKDVKKAAKSAKPAADLNRSRAHKRLVREFVIILPEIQKFNDDGTMFQKSPRKSLKVLCTYVSDNAKYMSPEQHAAIADLLFTIRIARSVGALGEDESELSALNSIRRRGMKVSEVRDFTNRIQVTIKERKARRAMDKKKAVKAPAAKQEKLVNMSEHVRKEIARIDRENAMRAKKGGAGKPTASPTATKASTGISAEPLMKGATAQKTAA
jgi:hypothetical protein